jgi:sporulation protein YlmC with PRC-barrel domain
VRLDLDCPVICADGAFGELSDILIDPGTRRVTHLVVQPHERHYLARLMPIGRARVDEVHGEIALECTVAELNDLKPIHESEYVRLGERPADEAGSDVGIEDGFELPPYESLGTSALGAGMEQFDTDPHVTLSYDRVPKGTVEIRRQSAVTSSDGHHLGHVVALLVDTQAQIAKLVLEHGHLWGKREMAIPGGSIDLILSDEIVLSLAKDEVGR